MIIFNTTFHVEEAIHNEFIEYMLKIFIPKCTKSGLISSPRLAKIFGKDEDEGISYAMEFIAKDLFTLERWNKEESGDIYAQLMDNFKEKIIGFSTVMQTVDY